MNTIAKVDLSLRALARTALEQCGGNTAEATDAVAEILANDKRLARSVAAEAIALASYELVQHRMRDNRSAVVLSANRSRDGVAALANGIRAALLDFPLAGGMKLRDATPDEVTEQIDRYDAIGRDVSHKAKWLRLIVQSVPRNKLIGEVISDDRAQELWNEASK